ncbi:MAG: beta-ketoacyl-ACP synthase III, partial [Clostridia bacterium]
MQMFKIMGTGHCLPERVVSNDELSTFIDTSDEWISKRTGIRNRHVITTETTSQLGTEASKRALEMAGVEPSELDLIIGTTSTNETTLPGLGCMVQKNLGATCPAFDICSACSGFLVGLDAAAAYFKSGRVKKVLVVSAENMTRFVDWNDRSTCVLFGDGAGAVVLGEGDNLLSIKINTHGNNEYVGMHSAKGNSPFAAEKADGDSFTFMNGQETYKYAIGAMSGDIIESAEMAGIKIEDIDHIVPHQANLRIISATQKKLEIPMEKFCVGIENLGNTSSASEPIVLDIENHKGRFKEGDILAFT